MKAYWSYILPDEICMGQHDELWGLLKYQYGIDLSKLIQELKEQWYIEEKQQNSEKIESFMEAVYEKIRCLPAKPWYEKMLPKDSMNISPIGETEEIKNSAKRKDLFFLMVTYAVYLSAKDDVGISTRNPEEENRLHNFAPYLNEYAELLSSCVKSEAFAESEKKSPVFDMEKIKVPENFNNSWYQKKDNAKDSETARLFIDYIDGKFISTKAHYNYLGFVNCELYAKCPMNGYYEKILENDSIEKKVEKLVQERIPISRYNFMPYAKKLHTYFRIWIYRDQVIKESEVCKLLQKASKGSDWEMLLVYENILPCFSLIVAIQECLSIRESLHKDKLNGRDPELDDKDDFTYYPDCYGSDSRLLLREIMKLQNIFIIEEIVKVYWVRRKLNSYEHINWKSDAVEWGESYEYMTPEEEIWSKELREMQCSYYPLLEAIFIEIMEYFVEKVGIGEKIGDLIEQLIDKVGKELNPAIYDIFNLEKLNLKPIDEVTVAALNDFYYAERKYSHYRAYRNRIDLFKDIFNEQSNKEYAEAIRERLVHIRNRNYNIFTDKEDDDMCDKWSYNQQNKQKQCEESGE